VVQNFATYWVQESFDVEWFVEFVDLLG